MGDFARGPSIAFPSRQTGGRDPATGGFAGRLETWLEAERAQLPLWLPVGLTGGIAAWFVLPSLSAWRGFLLVCLGLALLGLGWGRGGRLGRAVALFALAAALGCGSTWWRAERIGVAPLARPAVVELTGRIERVDPLPARAMTRLWLRVTAASASPSLLPGEGGPSGRTHAILAVPIHVRLNLLEEDVPAGLARGAVIRVRSRLLAPPAAAVPGAYDYAPVAWFQGIGATGKALGPARIVAAAPRGAPADWLADARQALTAHIVSRLPAGEGGVAAALATGDMGAVPDADNDAFRRSGLAHLLSVSGLHLTAAVGATMWIALRLLALMPWLALRAPLPLIAAGLGALAGIAYTLLTGSEVPTVRSLVAALVVLAGVALGREAMTLRLVAVGALAVLLPWPESAAGPSFQLSFAAILSIVAFHDLDWTRRTFEAREEGRLRRLARSLAGLLATGLVVEAALAPIAIFHFHRAGLYGAAANIVAIPLTTFIIMPAEALALLADVAGVGAPFWWITGKALSLLLTIAHHVGELPGAVTLVPAMSATAFGLIAAGGLWLALWRTRVRLAGLLPIGCGVMLTALAQPPDLFVTGDGRHVAVRLEDGGLALLRERTGDYMRTTLAELSGRDVDDASLLDTVPQARCGPDLCAVDLDRGGRRWRLLATRSPYPIDRPAFARACAQADIIVSDRRLPGWCAPRWLKADAGLLVRTGGLAIRLAPLQVSTVAAMQGDHPWASWTRTAESDTRSYQRASGREEQAAAPQ